MQNSVSVGHIKGCTLAMLHAAQAVKKGKFTTCSTDTGLFVPLPASAGQHKPSLNVQRRVLTVVKWGSAMRRAEVAAPSCIELMDVASTSFQPPLGRAGRSVVVVWKG